MLGHVLRCKQWERDGPILHHIYAYICWQDFPSANEKCNAQHVETGKLGKITCSHCDNVKTVKALVGKELFVDPCADRR